MDGGWGEILNKNEVVPPENKSTGYHRPQQKAEKNLGEKVVARSQCGEARCDL